MEIVVVLAELIHADGARALVSLSILNNLSGPTESTSMFAVEQPTEGGDVLIEALSVVLIREPASILRGRLREREHRNGPTLFAIGKEGVHQVHDFLVYLAAVNASTNVTEPTFAVEPRKKIDAALRTILPATLRLTKAKAFDNLKTVRKFKVCGLEGVGLEQFGQIVTFNLGHIILKTERVRNRITGWKTVDKIVGLYCECVHARELSSLTKEVCVFPLFRDHRN